MENEPSSGLPDESKCYKEFLANRPEEQPKNKEPLTNLEVGNIIKSVCENNKIIMWGSNSTPETANWPFPIGNPVQMAHHNIDFDVATGYPTEKQKEQIKASWDELNPKINSKSEEEIAEELQKQLKNAKEHFNSKLLKESTSGVKFDEDKLDWSLIPIDSLEEILKVLEFGRNKYEAWNWSKGDGFKYTKVLSALLRHIFAYMRGEDNDPESGLSHMAHAGCNVLFILYFIKHKNRYNKDDRPKP